MASKGWKCDLLSSRREPGYGPQSFPVIGAYGKRELEILRERLANALACEVTIAPIKDLDSETWVGLSLPCVRHSEARAYLAGYQRGKLDGVDLHQGRKVDAAACDRPLDVTPIRSGVSS